MAISTLAPEAAHVAKRRQPETRCRIDEFSNLAEMEKRHILAALDHCNGNRTHAAKLLDISIRTLRNKLHEYNGTVPQGQAEEETVSES